MQRQLEELQIRFENTVARAIASLRRYYVLDLLLDTFDSFNNNLMGFLAASLSYYALLALFPLLLLMIGIAPLFVSDADAVTSVLNVAQDYLPGMEDEVRAVLGQVAEARGPATIIGILTLIWSASGVFDVLQRSFDRAWRVSQPRAFWLQRLFSIGVIGLLGAFFFASAFLSAFSEAVIFGLLGNTGIARVVRWGGGTLGALFAFVAFLILYKTFPHAKVEWKDALVAAIVATVLWHAAKYLYEWYLLRFARFNLVYGSVGAVIGLLLWGYISATIVLLCAELSATRAHKRAAALLREL